MERSEVSTHEVAVVRVLQQGGWQTNAAIAEAANISPRTVRQHTLRLTQLGLLDVAEVFPAHRYRWSENARKRNRSYVERIERAAEALA